MLEVKLLISDLDYDGVVDWWCLRCPQSSAPRVDWWAGSPEKRRSCWLRPGFLAKKGSGSAGSVCGGHRREEAQPHRGEGLRPGREKKGVTVQMRDISVRKIREKI